MKTTLSKATAKLDEHDKERVQVLLDKDYTEKEALEKYQDVTIHDDWDEIIEEWYDVMGVPEKVTWYIDEEKLKTDLDLDLNIIEIRDGRLARIN